LSKAASKVFQEWYIKLTGSYFWASPAAPRPRKVYEPCLARVNGK
jgi:hypothetical protein